MRGPTVVVKYVLIGMLYACGYAEPRTDSLAPPPALGQLTPLYQIAMTDSSPVGDVLGLRDCRAVLVGSLGTLQLVQRGTVLVQRRDLVGRASSRLYGSDDDGVLLVGHSPAPLLAKLDPSTLDLDSLVVPMHHWGQRWTGPAWQIGERIVFAPLMDSEIPRKAPLGAVASPLFHVLDLRGKTLHEFGPALEADEHYRSWRRHARGVMRATSDTIRYLLFDTGDVHKVSPRTFVSTDPIRLPRYFSDEPHRVEVLRFPWIQFGDFPYFMDTPQVLSASFSRTGMLYAIRPYGYKWQRIANPHLEGVGVWILFSIGLEVYDSSGELVSAYQLPPNATAVRTDDYGRVFVKTAYGVEVYQDPLNPRNEC